MLDWTDFRAFPLYIQFVVVLMVLYATLMTVLTGLLAVQGAGTALITLGAAAVVWVLVLRVVPARLGRGGSGE